MNMKIITPSPLAHNTLSDTPTTQQLIFWLIELKICIFIKIAPPSSVSDQVYTNLAYVPLRTRE